MFKVKVAQYKKKLMTEKKKKKKVAKEKVVNIIFKR